MKKDKQQNSEVNNLKAIIDSLEGSGLWATKGNDPELKITKIPFGISTLDKILGGGLPLRRIVSIIGESAVGKTFICQKAIEACQKMDKVAIYYNAENKYDPEWFTKTGVDTDKLIVVTGNIGESVWGSVQKALGNENVGLIVMDSVSSLVPTVEADDDMDKDHIALQARMNSKAFRKIVTDVANSNTCLLCNNQLRQSIGGYIPLTSYPGGKAQAFYTSIILVAKRGDWIAEDVMIRGKAKKVNCGFMMKFKTDRNTLAAPLQTCAIPFKFTGELDNVSAVITVALDMGIIKQRGPSYEIEGVKFRGRDAVEEWAKANPEEFSRLEELVVSGEYGKVDQTTKDDDNETEEEIKDE